MSEPKDYWLVVLWDRNAEQHFHAVDTRDAASAREAVAFLRDAEYAPREWAKFISADAGRAGDLTSVGLP